MITILRGPARSALWTRSLGVMTLTAALAVTSNPAAAQGVGLPIGTVLPASGIEVQDLDGNAIDLMSLVPEGKPALFEFWATWCEQCEALQPQLDQIQIDHGDDLTIIAVAVAVSQTPRRIKRHLEGHDPGYPHIYDHRGAAVRAFNAAATAIVTIVDADRKVIYSNVGPDQNLRAAALAAVGPAMSPAGGR